MSFQIPLGIASSYQENEAWAPSRVMRIVASLFTGSIAPTWLLLAPYVQEQKQLALASILSNASLSLSHIFQELLRTFSASCPKVLLTRFVYMQVIACSRSDARCRLILLIAKLPCSSLWHQNSSSRWRCKCDRTVNSQKKIDCHSSM